MDEYTGNWIHGPRGLIPRCSAELDCDHFHWRVPFQFSGISANEILESGVSWHQYPALGFYSKKIRSES
jgi:hypothetical protein